MKRATLVCLTVATAAVTLGPAPAQATVKRQVQINVLVCQGDPHGSRQAGTVELLNAPQLSVADKQTDRYFIGQAFPVDGGRKRVDIGIGSWPTCIERPRPVL
jgi:hypothetical protein